MEGVIPVTVSDPGPVFRLSPAVHTFSLGGLAACFHDLPVKMGVGIILLHESDFFGAISSSLTLLLAVRGGCAPFLA